MSFLAPLYLAGLAAVSLPVLFHLIRRTSRGRQAFSAVMFLVPTPPPRITRRSRLENWPLLLLRALALCLLALAFSRPFFRHAISTTDAVTPIDRKVILLDTSASMLREDLWEQAILHAADVLAATAPADQVCVSTFDREPRTVLRFAEWVALPPTARTKLALDRLAAIAPARESTDLGRALITAAELLASSPAESSLASGSQTSASGVREVILISDLQLGSRLAALQSYEWPDDVRLVLKTVTTNKPTNAGFHALGDSFHIEQANNDTADGLSHDGMPAPPLRIAITNASDSTGETFQIRLHGGNDAAPLEVYVPPGASRSVRVPEAWIPTVADHAKDSSAAPAGLLRLVLDGDDHGFDNTLEIGPAAPQAQTVVYLGSDARDDPADPLYYVARAFPRATRRMVNVVVPDQAASLQEDLGDHSLVIAADVIAEPHLVALRRYLAGGGTLVYLAKTAGDCKWLESLLECGSLAAAEAEIDGYAMLADLDFDHPVLAPFADVRFADFTKIHIWRHRRIHLDAGADCRVLARFDNGAPAIFERNVGAGRVFVFAAGWHPADSQLALSTKFVPLLNGILDYAAAVRRQSTATDRMIQTAHAGSLDGSHASVILADGRASRVDGMVSASGPSAGNSPIAAWTQLGASLAADESKTSPLPVEKLESLGVRLATATDTPTSTAAIAQHRQLLTQELEQRQKLWRGLIVGAIAVLILETCLARRIESRPHAPA